MARPTDSGSRAPCVAASRRRATGYWSARWLPCSPLSFSSSRCTAIDLKQPKPTHDVGGISGDEAVKARSEGAPPKRHARIIGTGSALPQRVVTNAELARELAGRGVETSDEWIVARTGIRQRYIAEEGVTSAELGTQAARAALAMAEVPVD